jgi:hypothetical protein
MNGPRAFVLCAAAVVVATALVGCVQYPTEKASIVDMRPQVSFVIAEDSPLRQAKVYVNGLDVGKAGDYLDGKAAVRILPGANVIKVVDGSRTVLEERVYLSDGVARSFSLK